MNTILLPLIVAIPLGGAFLIPLVSRRSKTLSDVLGNLATFSVRDYF